MGKKEIRLTLKSIDKDNDLSDLEKREKVVHAIVDVLLGSPENDKTIKYLKKHYEKQYGELDPEIILLLKLGDSSNIDTFKELTPPDQL